MVKTQFRYSCSSNQLRYFLVKLEECIDSKKNNV